MSQAARIKGFVLPVHAFRGFAILNVVAAHAWSGQVYHFSSQAPSQAVAVLTAVTETLFHDSTIYFALISGLLFSLVLQSRGWRSFYFSKIINVIAPYLVMSFMFTYFGHDSAYELTRYNVSVFEYLSAVFDNVWTGGAFFHLWYIPVLAVLYLVTPLVAWLLDRSGARWIVGLIVILPLFVSRVYPEVSWTNPVYFLGAYTAGMLVGRRYSETLDLLRRYQKSFLAVALLSTVILITLFLIEFDWVGFVSIRESVWYAQKLALSAVVLLLFQAREQSLPAWLSTLATYAFAIYFLHAMIQMYLVPLQRLVAPEELGALALLASGFVYLIISIWLSVKLAQLIQLVVGKHSRLLVGA